MVAQLSKARFRTIPNAGKFRQWLTVVGGVIVTACMVASGPKDYELPDPDSSLDPAALQPQNLIYACGQWAAGETPSVEKIFVDVAFFRSHPDDPRDRPSDHHLATLKKYGGEVAYTFHFPAVRAWISRAAIPALAAHEDVISVLRIGDLRRYDWSAIVGYRSQAAYEAGLANFKELGGRVDYQFASINAIGGLIPDRSVGILRKKPEVQYVDFSGPIPSCKME